MIVADALDTEAQQRRLLGEYIAKHMVEGTDYGVIPGTERKNRDGSPAPTPKTLLKPGAEKLTQLFRCVPRFVVVEKIEDWDKELFFYRFTCQIVTQEEGTVVAEGVGSCSTYESRYRWRNSARKCPECGKEAIIKGKSEYGGGWLCWKKKDGCGAQFADNAPEIVDQPAGRVKNPDLLDCVNTVLKIAKKRALVDAAISLARCSDIFTQDVEDFHEHEPTVQDEAKAKISRTTRQEFEAKFHEARLSDDVRKLNAEVASEAMKKLLLPGDLNALRATAREALDRTKHEEQREPASA